LSELDLTFSERDPEQEAVKEPLRVFLQSQIDEYFDTRRYPDKPERWMATKAWFDMAHERHVAKIKPSKKEQTAANFEATKQKQMAKAERPKPGEKRIASTEVPGGSEEDPTLEELVHARQLVCKRLKLQYQYERIIRDCNEIDKDLLEKARKLEAKGLPQIQGSIDRLMEKENE
jgi:hypothetical protein